MVPGGYRVDVVERLHHLLVLVDSPVERLRPVAELVAQTWVEVPLFDLAVHSQLVDDGGRSRSARCGRRRRVESAFGAMAGLTRPWALTTVIPTVEVEGRRRDGGDGGQAPGGADAAVAVRPVWWWGRFASTRSSVPRTTRRSRRSVSSVGWPAQTARCQLGFGLLEWDRGPGRGRGLIGICARMGYRHEQLFGVQGGYTPCSCGALICSQRSSMIQVVAVVVSILASGG